MAIEEILEDVGLDKFIKTAMKQYKMICMN